MNKLFNVRVLVGVVIAGFGIGMSMVFALNAPPNHVPYSPPPASSEGPKGKVPTVAVASAAVASAAVASAAVASAAVAPTAIATPTIEHYWYLTKVTAGYSYRVTRLIGIAASFYTSRQDCESVKSRWAHDARHESPGIRGLLAEKQVEDSINCVEDASPVWKGLRPEKRWFLFPGVEPEAYGLTKSKSKTSCTVKLAITSSGYMSGWNFENLHDCSENFPLWTRSVVEAQSSWRKMAGSGLWARTDKKEGAEAYEQGYICMACVRGNSAAFSP
jgi:hypothetical protein